MSVFGGSVRRATEGIRSAADRMASTARTTSARIDERAAAARAAQAPLTATHEERISRESAASRAAATTPSTAPTTAQRVGAASLAGTAAVVDYTPPALAGPISKPTIETAKPPVGEREPRGTMVTRPLTMIDPVTATRPALDPQTARDRAVTTRDTEAIVGGFTDSPANRVTSSAVSSNTVAAGMSDAARPLAYGVIHGHRAMEARYADQTLPEIGGYAHERGPTPEREISRPDIGPGPDITPGQWIPEQDSFVSVPEQDTPMTMRGTSGPTTSDQAQWRTTDLQPWSYEPTAVRVSGEDVEGELRHQVRAGGEGRTIPFVDVKEGEARKGTKTVDTAAGPKEVSGVRTDAEFQRDLRARFSADVMKHEGAYRGATTVDLRDDIGPWDPWKDAAKR